MLEKQFKKIICIGICVALVVLTSCDQTTTEENKPATISFQQQNVRQRFRFV